MTNYTFPKMLKRPEMMCVRSWPVTEATDGGLKTLVALMGKCSHLEVCSC